MCNSTSRCLSSRNTVTLPSYCGSFESEENEAGEVEAPEAEDDDEANKGYNEILNVLERLENETEGEVNKDTSESRLLNLKSPDLNKKSSFCNF